MRNNYQSPGYRSQPVQTFNSRWVSLIIVRLNVRVRQRFVKASHNGLNVESWLVGKGIRKDIAGGHIDRLLEQIVFEDDETGVYCRGVTQNMFPIGKHLADGCETTVDAEVCETSN